MPDFIHIVELAADDCGTPEFTWGHSGTLPVADVPEDGTTVARQIPFQP